MAAYQDTVGNSVPADKVEIRDGQAFLQGTQTRVFEINGK